MFSPQGASQTGGMSTSRSPSARVGGLVSSVLHPHGKASQGAAAAVSVSAQVKNVLNRSGLYLHEKAYDLTRLLEPCLAAHRHQSGGGAVAAPSASPAFSVKDLDSIFLLLVGDVFGSQAARAARYGQGWNLLGLLRSRHWRDYHAALTFLGSSGVLARLAAALGDSGATYDYPTARLPFRTAPTSSTNVAGVFDLLHHHQGQPQSQQQQQEFVSLSPFDYYLYHFLSLVNHCSEWGPAGVAGAASVDGDSLYPVLFEDLLSAHLPIGAENFKLQHFTTGILPQQQQHDQQSPTQASSPARPSLFKTGLAASPAGGASTVSSDAMASPYYPHHHLQPASPYSGGFHQHHFHSQTWRSYALVDAVTKFWLVGWYEEEAQLSSHQTPRVPTGDVVKMVRMFVKHVHYFLNSVPADLRDSLSRSLLAEFFPSLLRLLSFLLDHWPLDASFRLVLETWLSAVQPWRYREEGLDGGDENSLTFVPGPWDAFVARQADFYNVLFPKLVSKLFRLDLGSGRGAFMVFRVAKVLSQDGLADTLRVLLARHSSPARTVRDRGFLLNHGGGMHSPGHLQQQQQLPEHLLTGDFKHIFDDNFRSVVESLILRIMEARAAVLERRAALLSEALATAADQGSEEGGGGGDLFSALSSRIRDFFLLGDGPGGRAAGGPGAEADELGKTAQNLEFAEGRLAAVFRASPPPVESVPGLREALELSQTDGTTTAGGRSIRRRRGPRSGPYLNWHDDDTPMTPQKRWEIVNRVSRYSPKYQGNPDEAPLRSDEFHFLARRMHRLSQFLNSRLPVESAYSQPDLAGAFVRQLARPPAAFRAKNPLTGAAERRLLPPRLSLRPLASYAFAAYLALFLAMLRLFPSFTGKLVFLAATLWILAVCVKFVRTREEVAAAAAASAASPDAGAVRSGVGGGRRRIVDMMDETLEEEGSSPQRL